jgi:hemerythrin-like domain-containing protein
MVCPRKDHILFEKIRAEHERILASLESWPFLPTDEEKFRMAEWLWNFVELKHHAQEELLLFQRIYNHPKIGEGGPLCTLYFDFHMSDNPIEHAKRLSKQTPVVEAHQKILYESGSPVRIPLDEHRAGKEVLRYLLAEWAHLSEAEKTACMTTYQQIQSQHILKEESCFFHLCLRLFSEDELKLLSEQWKAA